MVFIITEDQDVKKNNSILIIKMLLFFSRDSYLNLNLTINDTFDELRCIQPQCAPTYVTPIQAGSYPSYPQYAQMPAGYPVPPQYPVVGNQPYQPTYQIYPSSPYQPPTNPNANSNVV